MTAAVNYTKQQKVLEMVSVDKKNRQPWYFPMTALRLSKGLAEHEYHRKRERFIKNKQRERIEYIVKKVSSVRTVLVFLPVSCHHTNDSSFVAF